MAHLVATPVLLAADAHGVVVREHARPHQRGVGLIVVVVRHGDGRRLLDGDEQRLGEAVGQGDVRRIGEIALHDVRHHVGDAAGQLIARQGERQLRIHDREARAMELGGQAALEVAFNQGDDGGVAALAAGGGDGQHAAVRQRGLNLRLAAVEIPEIAVIRHAVGDGLCGINRAAAAHGQQEIEVVFAAEADAFVDKVAARIGLDAAELAVGDARRLKGSLDLIKQAAALHAAAAVNDQRAGAARLLDEAADLHLGVFAENKFRGGTEFKIQHGYPP